MSYTIIWDALSAEAVKKNPLGVRLRVVVGNTPGFIQLSREDAKLLAERMLKEARR